MAAVIASRNILDVGGYVPTAAFHQDKVAGVISSEKRPYAVCIDNFFTSVLDTIVSQRTPWKRLPMAFFFDHSDRTEWRIAIVERYDFQRAKHPQFKELAFSDKTDHPPLQAADMIAYRSRQIISKVTRLDFDSRWDELDNLLLRKSTDYFNSLGPEHLKRSVNKFFRFSKPNP